MFQLFGTLTEIWTGNTSPMAVAFYASNKKARNLFEYIMYINVYNRNV